MRTPSVTWALLGLAAVVVPPAFSQPQVADPPLTLQRLIDPTTVVRIDGKPVRFALHGLIEFDTLGDLFRHVDAQAGRWQFATPSERQRFGDALARRGIESRIVSMVTERPLEVLLTHTAAQVTAAAEALRTPDAPLVFKGAHWQLDAETYRDALLRVRERWSTSLNCWSAASTIPARVLSNWYLIDEGITLFGATYDSTEHFWQAVKFHPDTTVADVDRLLAQMLPVDWAAWLSALEADQSFYLANTYAVEFLKVNLTSQKLQWFRDTLAATARPEESARRAQQRVGRGPGQAARFTALDEKVLWGDLADVLHLVAIFGSRPRSAQNPDLTPVQAVREAVLAARFDAIYVDGYAGGRVGFLSPEFQQLMLEIWKVKYLEHERFGEVIRSTVAKRLDHFLNDGDSPDIPIPVYVGQLNRIRDMALERAAAESKNSAGRNR